MIPKIIHYCWFGKNPMPNLESKCLKSWSHYLSNYEIMKWDETSFDIEEFPFVREAYYAKKYAFVSDFVRVYVLNKYGGIYLDTDVEVLKSFDVLLNCSAFTGFETTNVLQTGVIGAEPHHWFIKEVMEYYTNRHFIDNDGKYDQTPNSVLFSNTLLNYGLVLNNCHQIIEDIEIYPSDYFCPINQATQEISVSINSYCIHYLSGSWLSSKDRLYRKIKKNIGEIFGFKLVSKIRNLLIQ